MQVSQVTLDTTVRCQPAINATPAIYYKFMEHVNMCQISSDCDRFTNDMWRWNAFFTTCRKQTAADSFRPYFFSSGIHGY